MSNNPFMDYQEQFFKLWNDNMDQMLNSDAYKAIAKNIPGAETYTKAMEAMVPNVENYWKTMASSMPAVTAMNPVMDYWKDFADKMPGMDYFKNMPTAAQMMDYWKNFADAAKMMDYWKQFADADKMMEYWKNFADVDKMMETWKEFAEKNPFMEYWKGFTGNFKQATITWLIALVLIVIGWFNVRICQQAGGFIGSIRYGVYALGIILFIILVYLFPTMAAFSDTLPNLIRNSIYWAIRKPFKLLVSLFFHFFPMFLTYTDRQFLPLYAFIWTTFGFAAIVLLTDFLLLSEFEPYLPLVDECGDFIINPETGKPYMPGEEELIEAGSPGEAPEMSEEEILEEMRKLDGF